MSYALQSLATACAVLALCCFTTPEDPPADAPPAAAEVAAAKAVMVKGRCGSGKAVTVGSGVQLKHAGTQYILTCAHVVEDKVTVERKRCEGGLRETRTFKAVDVVTRDGADRETARRCLIVWYSVSDDVALLLPDDAGGLDGVELSRAKVRAGDSLWFCGGGVVDWNLSKSWAVRPGRNASGHFLVAAGTGWYGHSGSGVFADGNCGGPRLVGMICTAYGTGNARILGAVPAETILASIARYKAEVEDNSNEAGPPARRQ